MMEEEQWEPIHGLPYEVSDLGRIRNADTGYVLSPISQGQYRQVWMSGPQGKVRRYVHHLVLEAFAGPGPDGFQCNHKNGCKDDNRFLNLEWVTPQENTEHACANGLMPVGEKRSTAKMTEEDVRCARVLSAHGYSGRRLARMYGVHHTTMCDAISGRTWRHVA
jgi:hypothetical protein